MNLPTSLTSSLHDATGFDHDAFITVHELNEQVTSIRLNPGKVSSNQFQNFIPSSARDLGEARDLTLEMEEFPGLLSDFI